MPVNRSLSRSHSLGATLCRLGLTAAGLAGVALIAAWSGVGAIGAALRSVGWLFAPIAMLHLAPVVLDALAWRELFPHRKPPLLMMMAARWLREGVNALLPVAQVGGEIAATRALSRAGFALTDIAAALTLDVMAEFAALAACGLCGAAMLVMLSPPALRTAAWLVLAVMSPAALVAAGLLCARRTSWIDPLPRWIGRRWPTLGAQITRVVDSARAASSRRVLRGVALHILAWVSGAAETWVMLQALGHAVSPLAAFALETTSEVLRGFGLALPVFFAAQEGALVLMGALVGVPAPDAVALSLLRRGRDICVALSALAVWRAAALLASRRTGAVSSTERPASFTAPQMIASPQTPPIAPRSYPHG